MVAAGLCNESEVQLEKGVLSLGEVRECLGEGTFELDPASYSIGIYRLLAVCAWILPSELEKQQGTK
jgi:hypothetical protein